MLNVMLAPSAKSNILEDAKAFAQKCYQDADAKAKNTQVYKNMCRQSMEKSAHDFRLRFIIDEFKEVIADQYFDIKKAESTEE